MTRNKTFASPLTSKPCSRGKEKLPTESTGCGDESS
ncbi:unnamed protein product, partial [Allacma fusca]